MLWGDAHSSKEQNNLEQGNERIQASCRSSLAFAELPTFWASAKGLGFTI